MSSSCGRCHLHLQSKDNIEMTSFGVMSACSKLNVAAKEKSACDLQSCLAHQWLEFICIWMSKKFKLSQAYPVNVCNEVQLLWYARNTNPAPGMENVICFLILKAIGAAATGTYAQFLAVVIAKGRLISITLRLVTAPSGFQIPDMLKPQAKRMKSLPKLKRRLQVSHHLPASIFILIKVMACLHLFDGISNPFVSIKSKIQICSHNLSWSTRPSFSISVIHFVQVCQDQIFKIDLSLWEHVPILHLISSWTTSVD